MLPLQAFQLLSLVRELRSHKLCESQNCSIRSDSCHPTDYTVHGILRARILEWGAFPFSRASSQPVIEPRSPALQADSLPLCSVAQEQSQMGIILPGLPKSRDGSEGLMRNASFQKAFYFYFLYNIFYFLYNMTQKFHLVTNTH